jgi:hypothetical protein
MSSRSSRAGRSVVDSNGRPALWDSFSLGFGDHGWTARPGRGALGGRLSQPFLVREPLLMAIGLYTILTERRSGLPTPRATDLDFHRTETRPASVGHRQFHGGLGTCRPASRTAPRRLWGPFRSVGRTSLVFSVRHHSTECPITDLTSTTSPLARRRRLLSSGSDQCRHCQRHRSELQRRSASEPLTGQ